MEPTHQYVRAVSGRQSLLDVLEDDTTRERPSHIELLLVGLDASLAEQLVQEFGVTGPWTVDQHQVESPDALQQALESDRDFDLALVSDQGRAPASRTIRALAESRPGLGCIVLTEDADGDEAIGLMRDGARDCHNPRVEPRLLLAMQREITRSRERSLALVRRKELEEQLMLAQKMDALGRLAGGVAHEFNNALTVVISFAGFVRDDLGPDDPRLGDIVEVLRAADKAAALTRQLLTFSRRRPAEPRKVVIDALLANQEKILRRVVGEHIELVLQLQKDPWEIWIDPALFEQLLMNLVVNARDAMGSGGTLVVRTRNVKDAQIPPGERERSGLADVWWDEHVLLEVADTGGGIDEENLARVFEPLFTTRGSKASGLGLSVCYGIVKQAGGDIDVESAVGVGTTVRIALPLAHGRASTSTKLSAAISRLGGSETVLVVEDEEAVLQSVVRTLKEAGYDVMGSSRPEQVLSLLSQRESPPHLLITDVVMPGLSGTQLARQCSVRWPDLRVIFMTGYPDENVAAVNLESDGTRLLAKPFSGPRLLRTVRQVLEA
jgi:two-component system cell cycle sensor histidine kinase/response regulator CckA